MRGLSMQFPFESGKLWIGAALGMDKLDVAQGSRSTVQEFDDGAVLKISKFGVALHLSCLRPDSESEAMTSAPADPRFKHEETSGLGSASLHKATKLGTWGAEEEALPQFAIIDGNASGSIILPATSWAGTMHWKWFAQNGIIYRLTAWSNDFYI